MPSYEDRANVHKSAFAARVLKLVAAKKTNLCASLDVCNTADLLRLADQVGPYVCMIKTHIDIVNDFSYEGTVLPLKELARKHGFFLFEDRKFADIGNTVKNQYKNGIYKIAEWSDITNAHGVPGTGIIAGLRAGAEETVAEQKKEDTSSGEVSQYNEFLVPSSNEKLARGLLMLAELSCKGSLATGEYSKQTIELARSDPEFVVGFIAQNRPKGDSEDWLILTPGVGLDDKGDALGQQYRTVEDVMSTGTDIIIVGRGLYGGDRNPVEEAKRYQMAGWEAYQKINC
ncbi:Orotidine 5'-phosphate decarboxylase [Yarrowia sp. C11]|nr:Orotidine 5'-phosphate decarboxylase [Yarrowia sp. C11]KAG5370721.1 Orotidine 5'-phosphate decarboxylase [Yarrowia sp. E02]